VCATSWHICLEAWTGTIQELERYTHTHTQTHKHRQTDQHSQTDRHTKRERERERESETAAQRGERKSSTRVPERMRRGESEHKLRHKTYEQSSRESSREFKREKPERTNNQKQPNHRPLTHMD
jgi:hypothetical protein